MSETWLKFIPVDPSFAATDDAQKMAYAFVERAFPAATAIEVHVHEHPVFIDQGENFERVQCPHCQKSLDINWWKQAMDDAYETHFVDTNVIVPCCAAALSLNELNYEWPAGFARFLIAIRNPNNESTEVMVDELAQVIGSPLRQIWARY